MEIIIVIAVIVLFIMTVKLQKRVSILEGRGGVNVQSVSAQTPVPTSNAAVSAPQQTVVQAPSMPQTAVEEPKESWFANFINWLKDDWLLKLGALLLLIGFGWLVTYAFLNNWIGPMGRIALGIFAGVLILVLGTWRIKNFINQGKIFLLLGSTVILLTIFAAREMYDFFTPATALITMFLSTVYVAFVGVRHKTMGLVLGALVLAAVAPSLSGGHSASYMTLFTYLSVIIAATIWVVVITGWRPLTLASLIIAYIYSIPVLSASPRLINHGQFLLFAYAFVSVFYIFNIIGLIKKEDKQIFAPLVTAGMNGLFLLLWVIVAAPKEWQSLIIATWMLVFAGGAFAIFRATNRKSAFYIYAGISIAMLASATAVELEGSALTIAYIVESTVISLIAYGVLKNREVAERLNLLMIGPFLFSMDSLETYQRTISVFDKHFFVLLVMAVCLFLLGFIFRYLNKNESVKNFWSRLYIVQIILASVYVYAMIWFALGKAMDTRSMAIMTSMIIYTIIGLATYFYGRFHGKKVVHFYGGILLGLVVLRLLLVDVWHMDITRKIITFFMVGALLISTAFIGRKKKIQ